jgi:hypothetical protein
VHIAAAVGFQRGAAIRAHDAEVLQPIIVADTVDVIEDQRQPASAPQLSLTAQLAPACLEAFLIEPLLQMAPRE